MFSGCGVDLIIQTTLQDLFIQNSAGSSLSTETPKQVSFTAQVMKLGKPWFTAKQG
jgi:hypothetical protein